jgi:putative tryptophan/tyrosine transport system substrate-binding protein
MRRRDFIKVVAGSAITWPVAARAQQSGPKRRLGLLLALRENDPQSREYVTAFVESLRERGWPEGNNIQIDYRWCGDDTLTIRRAGVELIGLKPDVILAQSTLTLAPLQQLTTDIPVVFLQVVDPVAGGFVKSMARPGGNVTGVALGEFSIGAKMLEVLKQVAPQVTRVAVIYNPVQAPQVGMWRAIEGAGPSLSVKATAFSAGNADEITHIVAEFAREPGGGMIVLPNPVTVAIANRGLIISLADRYHLPAVYQFSYFVREGGLVSYGTDPITQYRLAASYVDQILRGAKPADLPVQLATKFELAINLKTAKALGLNISRDFLLIADEVIE